MDLFHNLSPHGFSSQTIWINMVCVFVWFGGGVALEELGDP